MIFIIFKKNFYYLWKDTFLAKIFFRYFYFTHFLIISLINRKTYLNSCPSASCTYNRVLYLTSAIAHSALCRHDTRLFNYSSYFTKRAPMPFRLVSELSESRYGMGKDRRSQASKRYRDCILQKWCYVRG